jgi:O-glycosyl hydrolase
MNIKLRPPDSIPLKSLICSACLLSWLTVAAGMAQAQTALPPGGKPVIAADALLATPVGGLERTQASAGVVPLSGQQGPKGLRVTIGANAPETNATQLTMPIAVPVTQGDVLLASFWLRGATAAGTPAHVELLFERTVDPWTKSVTRGATGAKNPQEWRRILVPFTAAETYRPGDAMVSLRFAFGPQTVEIAGLAVEDYGKSRTLEELTRLAIGANPLGRQTVNVRLAATKQAIIGFGGNFTAPRYGATAPFDTVARYNLDHLHIVHARIGIPLNSWAPQPGVTADTGPAHAALLQLQTLAQRKILVVASVWEGPLWLLPGKPEQQGRVLAPEKYGACIEAIASFLATARDRYHAPVDYFSFNEADYGVNFKFTSQDIIAFIRQAGPRFRQLGLKTRFLVGDTGGGAEFAAYAKPLLEDAAIAAYLGPLAFHCWDVLGAPDASYQAIEALGAAYHKPVWCTEAGHDSDLWQRPDPWGTWENALRTALAYARTLRLSGAQLMDYWTYEDDYPLVNKRNAQPYPVWYVVRQMQEALPAGCRIAAAASSSDDLAVLASAGPGKERFSLLLVNPVGNGQITISGLPANVSASVAIHTEENRTGPQRSGARTDGGGRLTIEVPARSVITITYGENGAIAFASERQY